MRFGIVIGAWYLNWNENVKKGAFLVKIAKVRMLLQRWFKTNVAEVEEEEHWTSYERQQGFFIHSDTAV